jgi:tetratricopeptide (TPR) repeat protein
MVPEFVIALCLLQIGDPRATSPSDLARIEAEIKNGQLQEAASNLEERLGRDNQSFQLHLLLGIVRQKQGRPEDALHEFQLSHDLQPDNPGPYADMGNVLAIEGRLDAAADQYANAIRIDPGNISAHRDLGLLRLQQKRTAEAIVELQQTVKLDSRDTEVWFALFQAQLAVGDISSARQSADKISILAPASSELFRSVAALQASAGDYQGAIPHLKKALDAAPDSRDLQYNLGLAFLRNDEAAKATPLLMTLRDRRDDSEIEDLLGEAYERQGKFVDAVRAYQRATLLDPRNEDYTYDYLTELLKHRDFDAALSIGKAAATSFPNSERMQLGLASAYYGKENVIEAHEQLVEASARFPDSSLSLYLRGVIAEAESKPDSSLIAQTQAYLTRHPGDSIAWLALGKAQAQDNQTDALTAFSRCLAIKETTAEAHLEVGRIYFDQHDWQKAAVHAQRAVELNPRLTEAWYRLALASYRLGLKSAGDAAMRRFKAQHASDQQNSAVTTFLHTLR